MADYPDWQTPAAVADLIGALGLATTSLQATADQISAAIATDGVPLLNKAGVIVSESAVTVPAGGEVQYQPSIIQPGYDLFVAVRTTGAGSTQVEIDIEWTESASGAIVDEQQWFTWAGPTATAHAIVGHGPTRGDLVNVAIINHDSANDVIMDTLKVLQHSRVERKHDLRSLADTSAGLAISGFTAASCAPQSGVISAGLLTVAGSTAVQRALPLYAGRVFLQGRTNSLSNDATFNVFGNSNTLVSAGRLVPVRARTNSNGLVSQGFYLPMSQCYLEYNNTNAASKNLACTIVAD